MSKIKDFFASIWQWITTLFMCPIGNIILKFKRGCGFLDLGKDAEVVGTVVGVDPGGGDGDICFNVLTDPGYEWLRFYKGRDTYNGGIPGTLHCEFMPCSQLFGSLKGRLQEVIKRFNAGEKVRVQISGRWSFDGVHSDAFATDGLTIKEVCSCILGHGANEAKGWCELHPCKDLIILN